MIMRTENVAVFHTAEGGVNVMHATGAGLLDMFLSFSSCAWIFILAK